MPIDVYLAFTAASALLVLAPGPMVALIVATSLTQRPSLGIAVVAGAASATAAHLSAICLGLPALLSGLGAAADWLRWVGVAYLMVMGVAAIWVRPAPFDEARPAKSVARAYGEAFVIQLSNPKTLMFYAAFFPLFLSPGRPASPQLILMSITFLAIQLTLDSCWAVGAARAAPVLRWSGPWANRIAGVVLIGAAFGFAGLGSF